MTSCFEGVGVGQKMTFHCVFKLGVRPTRNFLRLEIATLSEILKKHNLQQNYARSSVNLTKFWTFLYFLPIFEPSREEIRQKWPRNTSNSQSLKNPCDCSNHFQRNSCWAWIKLIKNLNFNIVWFAPLCATSFHSVLKVGYFQDPFMGLKIYKKYFFSCCNKNL